MNDLSALTNAELLAAAKASRAREHEGCVATIAHLAEIARRRLHVEEAFGGLRAYCMGELRYSWDDAGKRCTAAYLICKYPVVLEMLRSHQLHMTGLLLLSPQLTPENHRERLEAAVGKTCEEIKVLVATWAPKPHVETTIVRMTVDRRPELLERMVEERRVQESGVAPPTVAELVPTQTPTPQLPPLPRAAAPQPLDQDHYKLTFTVDAETFAALTRLTDLVSHSVPDRDAAKVISKAIKDQLKAVEKRKLGRTDKPKQLTLAKDERAPDKSRAPSASTRREVSERDGDRCCYVSPSGKRCNSTAWIEFDHKVTVAEGGETSVTNLRLYCRVHNAARNFIRFKAHGASSAKGDTPT